MRVLGIDPGTQRMGYGLVEDGPSLRALHWGTLTPPEDTLQNRLHFLYTALTEVIHQWKPQEMAVEEPFVGKNWRSALAIGQAQSLAFLAASQSGLLVHYYSPAHVKQMVADHGAAPKEQVQRMVALQLGLTPGSLAPDASDALAVALCDGLRAEAGLGIAP